MQKIIPFFILGILICITVNAQDNQWSDWVALNSYLEGRAKVEDIKNREVGYKWEFRIREKLFNDDPSKRNETLYVIMHQATPINLTSGNGTYDYDNPHRISFSPESHSKAYSPPGLFYMMKTKSDDFVEYSWKEGQIFPIAKFISQGGAESLWWGASLRIDQVITGNSMRFSPEKSNLDKFISVQ